MKVFKKIYTWILISVILQAFVLFIINNVVLVRIGNASSNFKLSIFGEDNRKKKTVTVSLPAGAENIMASFDGSYVSYITTGGKIEVISTEDNSVTDLIGKDNITLTGYKWLPDKNMIIYTYSVDAYIRVGITTYDVDSDIEHDYKHIAEAVFLPAGSRIADIQLSSKTNVTYVKIRINDTQAKIIRHDIHENRYYLMTAGLDTVIREIMLMDYMVYQEPGSSKVTFRQGLSGTSHVIEFGRKVYLLDNDSEYSMYVAGIDGNGNADSIYKGSYEEKALEAWQKVSLITPVPPGDIFISGTQVYIYVRGENAVYDINTDAKTVISGQLLQITAGSAVTNENGKVSLIPLK